MNRRKVITVRMGLSTGEIEGPKGWHMLSIAGVGIAGGYAIVAVLLEKDEPEIREVHYVDSQWPGPDLTEEDDAIGS